METSKWNVCQEDKKQKGPNKKVCEAMINYSELLLEADRAGKKTKLVKPRGLSLNKARNKARVLDIQRMMANNLQSIGKQQTISIEDFVTAQNNKNVPIMVRRCIARVQPKMAKQGQGKEESFASAIQICTWVFQRYGFVRKGSRTYALNKKGKDRNKYHRHRKDSSRFEQQFSRLYNTVFNPNKASKDSLEVVRLGQNIKASNRRIA